MAIHKYLDWKGWLEGLYLSWIKTITNTFLALLTTNGAQAVGIPHIGLNWQQALGICGTLTIIEIVKYLNAKPKPEVKEENIDTTIITK